MWRFYSVVCDSFVRSFVKNSVQSRGLVIDLFKKMMEKMGWTYSVAEPHKPRLYDPETGEYLNDETMQAIEDVRSGKDQGTAYESFEEFKKAMMALA